MEATQAANTLLRLARPEDAEAIHAIYAPIVRETPISFEHAPPAPEEIAGRIERKRGLLPWLVCTRGQALLGYAYADPHRWREAYRWSAEVSVYVREGARGQGVGRGLYTALLALLAMQGYANALAGITLPNPASVALHEALGFEPVGVYRSVGLKRGAWHDVGWWQHRLAEVAPEAGPPRDLAEVEGTPPARLALERAARLIGG